MKKKKVEILLTDLKGFKDPRPELEQYSTPPGIASDILNIVLLDSDGKTVIADLGSGTGMLSIAAALNGFEVHSVEKDSKAVETMRMNIGSIKVETGKDLDITIHEKDVEHFNRKVDKVVMNPPFGLQEENNNLKFLKKAFNISKEVFALLHSSNNKKQETREFLTKFANFHKFNTRILKTYDFGIPGKMSFHEKEEKDVKVDLYYFKEQKVE